MRRQILDDSVRFACQGCTACCDQPWRTLIEVDKAHALEAYDFGKYPQLAGRVFYHQPIDGREGFYELAKGEGTRCLFLDTDGLCIIHKELGPQAKPNMCRQFPLLPVTTPLEDRISASFGCPSVQESKGTPLTEQADEIAKTVRLSDKPVASDGVVPLDGSCHLTSVESDALFARALALFDPQGEGDVWQRFGELLALLVAVRDYKLSSSPDHADSDRLVQLLRSGEPLPNTPEVPEVRGWAQPERAPLPVRFLFAATMQPDTVPTDSAASTGLFKRLTLIPKLMALVGLSGGYASRLLGRNVSLGAVIRHEVSETLDTRTTHLLARYYRSRLWQRSMAGTRLSIMAGVHQHIHDLNAILFLARAEAQHQGLTQLTEPLVRQALTRVEFHLANQSRLYDQTLKGWLRAQLNDPALAFQSLRLMALKRSTLIGACRGGH